jgi:hypothetical protein
MADTQHAGVAATTTLWTWMVRHVVSHTSDRRARFIFRNTEMSFFTPNIRA